MRAYHCMHGAHTSQQLRTRLGNGGARPGREQLVRTASLPKTRTSPCSQ